MGLTITPEIAVDLDDLIMAARALGWTEATEKGTPAHDFLLQYHSDAWNEDLIGLDVDQIAQLAHDLWDWGRAIPADERQVRVRNVGSRTLVEAIGPDMPFIINSALGECAAQECSVLALFHPIVGGDDGHKQSMVQLHLERVADIQHETLRLGIVGTLDDVALTVADFDAMRARMLEAAGAVMSAPRASPEDRQEARAFLNWLADGSFTFLGSRIYTFARNAEGGLANEEPDIIVESGLGILRDPERAVLRRGSEPSVLTPAIQSFLEVPTPLIVAKSNMRSRVHRRTYADYIGIKRYGTTGEVIGEIRFVGLFTAEAYNRQTCDVPLLRRKVERVIASLGARPGSHNANVLQNIVETLPRDELFQIEIDDLAQLAMGLMHLMDRPKAKLFIRRDQFDRFLSALFFCPRERYTADLRQKVGALIARSFGGRISAYYPQFSETPLARVHFIVGLDRGHPEPDISQLNAEITALAENWEDRFLRAARKAEFDDDLRARMDRAAGAFSVSYRDRFDIDEAVCDARHAIGARQNGLTARAFRLAADGQDRMRCKLYAPDEALALSACVPVFENMGLFVMSETGYRLSLENGEVWVHDVALRSADGGPVPLETAGPAFEKAFVAVWTGLTENDGFNRLIPRLGVGWREAALIRTLARYRQQTGLDPSQPVQEAALADHPDIAGAILDLFSLRLDPGLSLKRDARDKAIADQRQTINTLLEAVVSLDADRVLRRIADLVMAITRTNYYQSAPDGGHPAHIAIKIASRDLADLPLPKPYREIFVWSPHVEGVHLRFGPVARGGLRWSDRRDDFRTEVLGLVKAQQVKNAVIVPVGSKGGFYPKHLPKDGTREAIREEGIRAYQTFINALLDVTDNLADGKVIPPSDTVVLDGEDPYLVVAADKGTATFSDIANEISTSRGFWLGDAFASGGSAGYDHKKMGITARGGWEAVKRHFREMGKDIQSEPFTVIGVGDMSGDVFGNGMLLSKHIRLLAAFDHRDIFIDPDPQDCASAFKERKRLFDMARSSWQDYDASLISKGGGVFSRATKSITLSAEIKALTGLGANTVTPSELMHALLKVPAELLWFGGIGTYVKAAAESHLEVGDKANDALRVNAEDLKAEVIGEGANLGLTQAGRIAFARAGGRINTDAIDNSAGVDSSDHEVNIKILLSEVIRSGELPGGERNGLLATMTDEVASLVLEHNYDQTLALSAAQASAFEDIDAHSRFMQGQEASGRLNRDVEGLPSREALRLRAERGEGLTRPELAVLLAYAKIELFDQIVDSNAPDDPWFDRELIGYFPKPLHKYEGPRQRHRLKREIIATRLANEIVNLGGPTFMTRVRESAEAETGAIVKAFKAAMAIFSLDGTLDAINALDNKVPATTQLDLRADVVSVLRRQTFWIARRCQLDPQTQMADVLERYQAGVEAISGQITSCLSEFELGRVKARQAQLTGLGAPKALALSVASLRPLISATDIIDVAHDAAWSALSVARLHHALGDLLGFDAMRAAAGEVGGHDHWDRLAVRRVIEDLMLQQQGLTRALVGFAIDMGATADSLDAASAATLAETWLARKADARDRLTRSIEDLNRTGAWSFAKLVLASDAFRAFGSEA
jgi:glutamate dehydrogenase